MVELRRTVLTVGNSVSQCAEMIKIDLGLCWRTFSDHDLKNCLASKVSSMLSTWEIHAINKMFDSLSPSSISLNPVCVLDDSSLFQTFYQLPPETWPNLLLLLLSLSLSLFRFSLCRCQIFSPDSPATIESEDHSVSPISIPVDSIFVREIYG